MIIDKPRSIPELRTLWKQAFGDTDEFLDCFFSVAYGLNRCRCVYENDRLAAMLYWFDCTWEGRRLAYIYAVATDIAFRGRGYCRALMENTHGHLQQSGYDGCILVPRTPELFAFYAKLGYRTCCTVTESICLGGDAPVELRQIDKEEYAALRRQFLLGGSVIQEGETLALLEAYSAFYAGENVLLAAYPENGKLTVCELLGNADSAPGVIAALGYSEGKVRTPGREKPFAMYHALSANDAMPRYFGLALD